MQKKSLKNLDALRLESENILSDLQLKNVFGGSPSKISNDFGAGHCYFTYTGTLWNNYTQTGGGKGSCKKAGKCYTYFATDDSTCK